LRAAVMVGFFPSPSRLFFIAMQHVRRFPAAWVNHCHHLLPLVLKDGRGFRGDYRAVRRRFVLPGPLHCNGVVAVKRGLRLRAGRCRGGFATHAWRARHLFIALLYPSTFCVFCS